MELIRQFIVFFMWLMIGVLIYRSCKFFVRYWTARKFIERQFSRALMINEHISPGYNFQFKAVAEVVEQIILQMCHGVKYQKNWMIRHAIEHKAVLYRTTAWLQNDPDDPVLHKALDAIKEKFYYMHGTFLDVRKSDLRNNIRLDVITTSGESVELTDEGFEYDPAEHGSGCRIFIIMSIVTPLTPKKYQYSKHLR